MIGERMKARRKELCMSADELGSLLGKNRATIYRYEKGEIEKMPLDILEPIAKALRTTPQYLMGWDVEAIEINPVEMAERHVEMVLDEDLNELFEDFKVLSSSEKQIIKDLARSLAKTKKGSSVASE